MDWGNVGGVVMNDMIVTLNKALDGFRIDAECVDAKRHRHFGFYDLRLGPKCQVSKIQRLSNEIALKIRSRTVPIVRSLSEEGVVRLQVVLSEPEAIEFENLYASSKRPEGMLPFLFGEMDDGRLLWNDMTQNPHMLVAGSTGSGKSVFLHNLIANAARTPNLTLLL